MSAVDLVCGDVLLRVDRSICETSTERVHWQRFVAPASMTGAPALEVRRVAQVENGTHIDAPLGSCDFRREGAVLWVAVEDGAFRGELVLRLAWYLVGTEAGAVLIHACALKRGDVGFVASGKSGDGKSTLSRLAREAGLELLTDEVVMLFADGTISGTPFRSDFDNAGRPGRVRARYFVGLRKAAMEALEPFNAMAAVQLAMSQCFDIAEVALPRVEVRRRLLAFLSAVEVGVLAFRKDVAAGRFVEHLLGE